MPNQKIILTDFEAKKRFKNGKKINQVNASPEDVSALEHYELEGPMIREFTIHILQTLHFLKNMDPIDDQEVEAKKINLPLKKFDKGIKKLAIFDLDECMAHCVRQERPDRPPDVRLEIKMQSGKILKAGFNVRPYIKQLLTDVNKYYEVAVFTASHKWYADVILDYIDPKGIFF